MVNGDDNQAYLTMIMLMMMMMMMMMIFTVIMRRKISLTLPTLNLRLSIYIDFNVASLIMI